MRPGISAGMMTPSFSMPTRAQATPAAQAPSDSPQPDSVKPPIPPQRTFRVMHNGEMRRVTGRNSKRKNDPDVNDQDSDGGSAQAAAYRKGNPLCIEVPERPSEKALVRAAITCNKNGIPFDPEKPFVTSGLRLGTPAATTRGFGVAEFKQVGGLIAEVLNAIAQSQDGQAPLVEASIKERVKALTDRFPIYQ